MENCFYTYTYSYPNGTPFYVGKGKGRRINTHLCDAKAGRKLNSFNIRVIRKLLENNQEPIIKKIVENVDEEFAFLVEEEFISKYGRRIDGSGILTNNTLGGEGTSGAKGIKRTPEQIEQMRLRLTGVKQSEKTKLKRKEKLIGYQHKRVKCPVCSKIGGITGMKRHHFQNCTGNTHEFRARVTHNGKRITIGRFSTKEEVEMAKQKYLQNVGA
jgi:hypothetical protein